MPSQDPKYLTSHFFTGMEQARKSTLWLLVLLLGSSTLAYPFAPRLLHLLVRPLGAKLVIYAPLEGFMGYVTVSFAAGIAVTAPYLLYLMYRLLRTGLHERVALYGTLAAGGLFLTGAGFCYLVILPVTLRFFVGFGGSNIAAGISVSSYLSMTLGLSTVCGILFELPLVVLILHHVGIISRQLLVSNRRYAVLLSAILTAILTPTPDAFTMSALLLPLIGLYEISIVLMWIMDKRAQASS